MVSNVNVIALLGKPQVFRVGLRVLKSSRWLVERERGGEGRGGGEKGRGEIC